MTDSTQHNNEMNLDDLIDKFKAYCQGEGDYDELDFKSDLIDWCEGAHDANL